ncbi:class I SAM-dependent methyltransferase [Streptomyces caelestis]|jgi:SAM-dependent methyltransferase|uniref:CcbJ n=1 Tax=Streptomyces caelestis TaxID=36816 RepID=E9JES0_9ACTN|nr:class I SAM-dependent methyltransferase [Streptomyces caelestis]ADB92558.1 CcbJ [Streptomyces caelestis]MBB5794799.1 SAM-dependent methyltransferase [Streptomyces caelestis]GGW28125.1 methyltransferase [Streptomyces caelestis]
MRNYDETTYGDQIADVYDEWPGDAGPPPDGREAALFVAALAAARPVLELGVGTGRVAFPLADLGVEVHGVESSEPMLDKLREKAAAHPNGNLVVPVLGNFAKLDLGEQRYSVVFAAFNTLFCLLGQDEQIDCMRQARELLEPGGTFVVQCLNPAGQRLATGNTFGTVELEDTAVHLEASKHDPLAQTLSAHHIVLSEGGGIRLFPYRLRYAYPAELDLMANVAGLELVERHADFERRRFDASSRYHVSVYRAAASA